MSNKQEQVRDVVYHLGRAKNEVEDAININAEVIKDPALGKQLEGFKNDLIKVRADLRSKLDPKQG